METKAKPENENMEVAENSAEKVVEIPVGEKVKPQSGIDEDSQKGDEMVTQSFITCSDSNKVDETESQSITTSDDSKKDDNTESKSLTTSDDSKKDDNTETQSTTTSDDSKKDDNTETQSTTETDEYMYTKREAFTSEIFKISVTNLPKKFGFKEFKKKLTQLELKPVKIKLWKDVSFVTFRCEEDREVAVNILEGLKWKGQELKAMLAKPAADPLVKKRKQEHGGGSREEKKCKTGSEELTPTERLKNSVTPLWKLSYEDQLKKKQAEMRSFFKTYYRQLEKNCSDLKDWLHVQRNKYGYIPCELQEIKPSPEIAGYRNKCEFTIGPGLDGQDVVGFRFGQYSHGTVFVGSPEDVSFLPDAMKTVVKGFQEYLSTSMYKAFNPEDHIGHWRQLAVRTSKLGLVMAMVDFHPQTLTQIAVEEEVSRLREYFQNGLGHKSGMTSCFFRSHAERMTGGPTDSPYRLVFGHEHITEVLLGMKFRISPNAFFQVNTSAAEVLYTQVSDWCNVSPNTTVLDVCCGTGTIGLTVAKSVEKVIGIEMCSDAVQDAKFNADLNEVSNVTYHCSKAEDVMSRVTRQLPFSSDVIAIVDPPRGGLHSSVVVTIRNCRSINRLVYVSCNVTGALNNLIDLVRPTSKRLKGPRFLPVKAVPIDLFPHTNHCELVILYEREKAAATDSD